MAHAYAHIDPSTVKRVFLLGPSHHVYTRKCALSSADHYDTPLGPLAIDQDIYAELKATGEFEMMRLAVDEAEHSLELHTPYIARVLRSTNFTLVPIMVGALNHQGEARYGRLLAPYLDDPGNLFIISSDFCHWGNRFSYTFYDTNQGPIWRSIEWLDQEGIKQIETGDPQAFAEYIATYKNTICGRHPIAVLLHMLDNNAGKFEISFTKYDQSSKCIQQEDSSVSYASAIVKGAAAAPLGDGL